MGVVENLRDEAAGVVTMLILGAGFVAMFAGQSWFWMVWVIGFAVFLPLVSIAFGLDDEAEPVDDGGDEAQPDALEELKRRYARGELDEAAFEARLERLLEAEDRDAAREYLDSDRRAGRTRREAE